MSDRRYMILFLGLISFSFSAYAGAPAFQEGSWETHYRMEVTGMPLAVPAISFSKTACFTGSNFLPDVSQPGLECKVLRTSFSENTATWRMQCQARAGSIEGQGNAHFHGDRLDGSIDAKLISAANPGLAVSYHYVFEGKRIGACGK